MEFHLQHSHLSLISFPTELNMNLTFGGHIIGGQTSTSYSAFLLMLNFTSLIRGYIPPLKGKTKTTMKNKYRLSPGFGSVPFLRTIVNRTICMLEMRLLIEFPHSRRCLQPCSSRQILPVCLPNTCSYAQATHKLGICELGKSCTLHPEWKETATYELPCPNIAELYKQGAEKAKAVINPRRVTATPIYNV